MTYEITLDIPLMGIETTIEALNQISIYNTYYNVPIEITRINNGYGIQELEHNMVELKIYIEEDMLEHKSIELIMEDIISALKLSKDEISYKHSPNQSYEFKLEDIDLGNNWVISYSQHDYKDKKVLYFKPHVAFGTGLHPTTQDCLRMILAEDFTEKEVIDLGTGSGILSIAAAVKNAKAVDAVDIEPVEEEILDNANLNHVSNIHVRQVDLLNGDYLIEGKYDWVFLNIGADETLTILKRHKLLEKNIHHYILSGLVEWNYQRVLETFINEGYSVMEKMHTDTWVTIHLIK